MSSAGPFDPFAELDVASPPASGGENPSIATGGTTSSSNPFDLFDETPAPLASPARHPPTYVVPPSPGAASLNPFDDVDVEITSGPPSSTAPAPSALAIPFDDGGSGNGSGSGGHMRRPSYNPFDDLVADANAAAAASSVSASVVAAAGPTPTAASAAAASRARHPGHSQQPSVSEDKASDLWDAVESGPASQAPASGPRSLAQTTSHAGPFTPSRGPISVGPIQSLSDSNSFFPSTPTFEPSTGQSGQEHGALQQQSATPVSTASFDPWVSDPFSAPAASSVPPSTAVPSPSPAALDPFASGFASLSVSSPVGPTSAPGSDFPSASSTTGPGQRTFGAGPVPQASHAASDDIFGFSTVVENGRTAVQDVPNPEAVFDGLDDTARPGSSASGEGGAAGLDVDIPADLSGAVSPSGVPTWTCARCTYANSLALEACEMCGGQDIATASSPPPGSSASVPSSRTGKGSSSHRSSPRHGGGHWSPPHRVDPAGYYGSPTTMSGAAAAAGAAAGATAVAPAADAAVPALAPGKVVQMQVLLRVESHKFFRKWKPALLRLTNSEMVLHVDEASYRAKKPPILRVLLHAYMDVEVLTHYKTAEKTPMLGMKLLQNKLAMLPPANHKARVFRFDPAFPVEPVLKLGSEHIKKMRQLTELIKQAISAKQQEVAELARSSRLRK